MIKKASNSLSKEDIKDFLEGIIALMPGHVYWKDLNSVYLGCNDLQAKSAGLNSRHEIIGKTDLDMPWKGQADILRKIDKKVIKTGEPQTAEEPSTLADGKNAIFLTKKVPLYIKGEIVGILGISFDITEKKEYEEALKIQTEKAEQAHLSRSAFLSTAAHEINNPLGGVIYALDHLNNIIQSLQDKFYDGLFRLLNKLNLPDVQREIDIIVSAFNELIDTYNDVKISAERAHQALKKLIQLHQLQINGIETNPELNSLRNIVQQAVNLARYNISNNIDIKIDFSAEIPDEIIIDVTNTVEILSKVIHNAIRFSKSGQRVKIIIDAEKAGDVSYIVFSIKDYAQGISLSQLEELNNQNINVFSKEFRYRKPSISLSIVKMRVEALKGKFSIESAPNQGTTVYIKIPLQSPYKVGHDVIFDSETLVSINENDHKANLKILLIEDDSIIQKAVLNILKKLGYQADSANTGEEGIKKALKNNYHVLLVDISLPDQLGTDVVKTLQQNKPNQSVYIAFTSHSSEEDELYFDSHDFMTVLRKPVSEQELDNCIQSVIRAQDRGSKTFY